MAGEVPLRRSDMAATQWDQAKLALEDLITDCNLKVRRKYVWERE